MRSVFVLFFVLESVEPEQKTLWAVVHHNPSTAMMLVEYAVQKLTRRFVKRKKRTGNAETISCQNYLTNLIGTASKCVFYPVILCQAKRDNDSLLLGVSFCMKIALYAELNSFDRPEKVVSLVVLPCTISFRWISHRQIHRYVKSLEMLRTALNVRK